MFRFSKQQHFLPEILTVEKMLQNGIGFQNSPYDYINIYCKRVHVTATHIFHGIFNYEKIKKQKMCFKSQAMAIKRVNFIVKTDNWHHRTKLTKLELFHQPTLMHNFLYSLIICLLHYYPRHVSSIYTPIFRRKNCIHTASGIFALCKCLHSTLVASGHVNE